MDPGITKSAPYMVCCMKILQNRWLLASDFAYYASLFQNTFEKGLLQDVRRHEWEILSDEGAVAGYGNRIRAKYTAKWGVQIAGMIFQVRSNAFSNSFITILRALILAYFLSTDSRICHGA